MQTLKMMLLPVLLMVLLGSCKEKNPEAKQLLSEIKSDYQAGRYQQALFGIDSLRHAYPNAIEERKEALKIHQDASLKMAQENLARVDSALQLKQREYAPLEPQVKAHRSAGNATASELQHFNELRADRDSLQTVFNVECAKIKYIHKRQKELTKDN